MRGKLFLACAVIEVVGIATVGCGIGIEIVYEADLGFLLITFGSLTLAGGSLLFAKVVRR